ncbi:hypothetical protein L21SP5_03230 [Salinivirga cyanobacteriivorans]|uniref:Uncharacterized protein n=1 Tax=Salinivirga cyanobacteriivorans TaxID=1307839 RepID=A0A0S2I4D0_9BACT|nr:choice-of-anchor J domain-containing protein [Salinivirga cyanobacteriivorans]ALO16844.1 hypothetical protein L21SP5_03230 [Salinivirga cyanobacteriivorans]
MRHLHFLLMLLFVVFSTFGNAQTIIQETFGSGIPTEWSVIDNNEDSQTWDGYASAGYTDTYSASIQAYAAHDDYLVMPQLTVEEGMTIEFVTKSHNTSWLEDMEVIASKDVDTAGAFNIQLGDYQNIPGTWTTYEIDLTANANISAGDNIYVAFRCYSNNAYYIYLDDVVVATPLSNDLSVSALSFNPATVLEGDNTEITATIENTGLNDQTGVVADFKVDGASIGTQSFDVTSGASTDVTLSWTAELGTHDITVELPADDNTANDVLTESLSVFSASALVEDFEGTFPPSGWTGDISSSGWKQYDLAPYEGTYSAYVSAGSLKRFITPKLAIDATSVINFWAKAAYGSHSIKLAYSTDLTTWTDVPSGSVSIDGTYSQYSVDLSAIDVKGNYYIAFVYNLNYTSVYLDNVVGPEVAVEAPVAAINPTPADAATAVIAGTDLTWEDGAGGVPTGYKVYFGTDSDGTTTPTNIENGTEQSAKVYSPASVLDYETTYYWQIIPTNSLGDASNCPIWSFTTESNPTQAIPYIEDFESVAVNSLPENWTSDFTYQVQENHGTGSSKGITVNMWSSTNTAQATTMPVGPLSATANQIVFDYRVVDYSGYPSNATSLGTNDKVELQVSADGGASFTTVHTIDQATHTTTTEFTTITHNLDAAYNGETIHVRFKNTWGTGDYFVDIDNVKIRETSTDPLFLANTDTLQFAGVPVSLSASKILSIMNDGGGTLQINDGNIALSGTSAEDFSLGTVAYPIELGAGESVDLELTYTPAAAGEDTVSLNITHNGVKTVNSVALIGSSYEPFATYFENFDATPIDQIPEKWNQFVDGAGTVGVSESTSDSYSQPNYLMLSNSSQLTGNLMAIAPALEMGNKRMVFYAKHGYYAASLSVGTMSDPTDPTTYTELQNLTLTGNYQEYEVDFSSYSGSDVFVAFKHELNSTYSTIFLDDVKWEEIPTTPVCEVSPATLDWGLTTVGQVSEQTLTVSNAGVGTLTINNGDLLINGINAADFAVGDITYPIELAADESADIIINFVPQAEGAREAILSVAHNGNNSPVEVPLSGDGLAGMLEDFNAVGTTFPPEGWTASDSWKALTFSTYEGAGGVWFNPAEDVTDAKLITPLLDVQSGDTFSFYAKKSTNDATLTVMYTDDTASGTWNDIQSFTITNTDYEQKTADLSAMPTGEYFIAIAGSGVAFTSTYIDYVQGPSVAGTFDINFIVTDQTTGDPIEGAIINVAGNDYMSDASGEALIQLSNGTFPYQITANGYEDYSETVAVNGAGQTVNVAMSPVDGYVASFTITDVDSNPVQGATVSIDGTDLITDASGTTEIILPNGEYQYTISADGYAPVTDTIIISDANVNITETLLNVYSVTFVVTDQAGNPINGAFVVIGSNFYNTNASGEVNVDAVNGTYYYTVTKADYEMVSGEVTVNGAAVTEEVTLRLVYVVYFEVAEPTGSPVENAEITIADSTLTTDIDGLAVIELPNGDYEATISKSGYEDAIENFTVSDAELDIPVTLNPVATTYNIYFNVTDDQSVAIEDATIELTNGIDTWTEITDATGEASFADKPNGTYDYTITKSGYEAVSNSVMVADGDEAVDISMTLVGIQNASEIAFNIYPNPTRNSVTINTDETEVFISVINANGDVVETADIHNKTTLNLRQYGTGVFFIRIQTAHGVNTRPVIVN